MKIFIVFLFFLLNSCQGYNAQKCEELATQAFRGFPKETNEYKHNCASIPHDLTMNKCQQVLAFFILKGKVEIIQKQFGEKSSKCLTKNDLEKFSR